MLLNDLIELRNGLREEVRTISLALNTSTANYRSIERRYSYMQGLIKVGKGITKLIKKQEYENEINRNTESINK